MSVEANRAVVRRAYEGFSAGDLSVIEECFSETYISRFPGEEPSVGRDALRAVIESFLEGFPDLKFTVEDDFGEGDKVAVRWTATGTHLGEFRGFPPKTQGVPATGRKVSFHATDIYLMKDGLIEEEWNSLEQLEVMIQIGVVPRAT